MCVTKDEFELPVCIADTAAELASLCGVSVHTVNSSIHRAKKGLYKSRFVRVEW